MRQLHDDVLIHQEAFQELRKLEQAAALDGIQLCVLSGHRSYIKQAAIWNAKASGERPVLNRKEDVIDPDFCTVSELIEAILTWSAIPGASRHHWGTDFDIYDASIKHRKEVELTQKEYRTDFIQLSEWLDSELDKHPFHRPYLYDRGGIACEPWHLSYTPLSHQMEEAYTLDVFKKNLNESHILFKQHLLRDYKNIFERYIKVSN